MQGVISMVRVQWVLVDLSGRAPLEIAVGARIGDGLSAMQAAKRLLGGEIFQSMPRSDYELPPRVRHEMGGGENVLC